MNNFQGCTYNPLEGKVFVLVSKKRCVIEPTRIILKKGMVKKNAIIKLKGLVVPKEINTKLYKSIFVNEKDCESIPFYVSKTKSIKTKKNE